MIIPKLAQDEQADYEGELVSVLLHFPRVSPYPTYRHELWRDADTWTKCFVLGRDAKNVPYEMAFDYIAAFTVGNDVSSRKLQRDSSLAGNQPQVGFSKGFDTYAPLGPCLVSAKVIKDPSQLQLRTVIDGELRQQECVSDLLFDCAYIVSYMSQGTTLPKGTVVMTGTPSGMFSWISIPQRHVP